MGKKEPPALQICPGKEQDTAAVRRALGRFYAGVMENRIRQPGLSDRDRLRLLEELMALIGEREG
ncbi:MAG: hypothetical protein PUC47_07810 [Oscillospiraceae bacterium]|nr:hypothetical protein [Oscillospiraceae bacterium]